MKQTTLKACLMASTLIGGLAFATPAMAQDNEAAEEIITITGTRIRNANLAANSPVTQVDAVEFELSGTTRVEDLLRTLPQVNPTLDGFTVNPSTGAASVDLRGLGTSRTLVLVNGRRMPAGNHNTTAPDLGTIPAPLVERVEILTGGASAVYGADAVAGVVNFIINRNFEGVSVSAGVSGYQHVNNNSYTQGLNSDAGYDVPTGTSNIDGLTYDFSMAMGSSFDGGRGHASGYVTYRKNDEQFLGDRDYSNCALNGAGTRCGGSSTTPQTNFLLVGDVADPTASDYFFDFAHQAPDGSWVDGLGSVYNYQPINFLQRPDERWTGGGFFSYQVSPSFNPYLDVAFTNISTDTQIAQTGTFYADQLGFECTDALIGSLCADLGIAVDPAGDDVTVLAGHRNVEGGARSWAMDTNTFRFSIGSEGDLASLGDSWFYDASATMAVTSVSEIGSNDFVRSRVADAILGCQPGSFAGCIPYLIFEPGGITEEAAAALAGTSVQSGRMETFVVSAFAGGDLFQMPAADAPASVVVGAEFRKETYFRTSDSLTQAGGFTGSSAAPAIDGFYDVWEAYGETVIPLISGQEFVEDLSIELGARYSSYSSAGEAVAYKAMANWSPTDEIRFRGGFNRAVRAPNVVELFLPQNGGLFSGQDPCAGATPIASAAECALTGVSAAQYGSVSDNPAGQYNSIVGGNLDLAPEEADTMTFGMVYTPANNFSMSIDYYDIEIANSIGTIGSQFIIDGCIATGSADLCSLINRSGGGELWVGSIDDPANPGGVGHVVNAISNFGVQSATGIDVSLSYADIAPIIGGNYSFSFNGTYNLERYSSPLPGIDDAAAYDCAGVISSVCSDPEWQHTARVIYDRDSFWTASLRWRHVGELSYEGTSDQILVSNGGQVDAFNYFDVSGTFDMGESKVLTVGVNNIFDEEPPLVGGSLAEWGQSLLGYDQAGRYIFGSFTLRY